MKETAEQGLGKRRREVVSEDEILGGNARIKDESEGLMVDS